MSGKVKKVTITGAALLAMGVTGPSVAAAEAGDENEQAPTLQQSAVPPATSTPAGEDRGTAPARSGDAHRD